MFLVCIRPLRLYLLIKKVPISPTWFWKVGKQSSCHYTETAWADGLHWALEQSSQKLTLCMIHENQVYYLILWVLSYFSNISRTETLTIRTRLHNSMQLCIIFPPQNCLVQTTTPGFQYVLKDSLGLFSSGLQLKKISHSQIWGLWSCSASHLLILCIKKPNQGL